ncbi:hypothetical protein MTR_5g034160 [Medicago truncatula]|uniref:Uncharacterized protein n=1 Tax=Medicago truncatula TaxID=3880 RepID=G7K1C6_MEDTR|nr:hypothetical protein MTR_5g034160 [Medicago truncatula]
MHLNIPLCIDEFKDYIISMQLDKCPSPDGFNSGFYHNFWEVCSPNIFQECCSWLNDGSPSLTYF